MKSILFALYQHFRTLPFKDALLDVLSAVRGVIRALFSVSKDSKVLSAARMAECEECEFFDETWRTCGTPGETMQNDVGDEIKIGCWCYLPLATRDKKKDCWARMDELVRPEDKSIVGWSDKLRPPP